MRPRGGIIGANITPTQTAASGIWTLREVEAYQRSGAWAALPGAPTSVSGTVGMGQVSLTWTAPAANGGYAITDYTVQYSSNSGSSWTTFSRSASATTSATVTGLTNGTGYMFRVAAVTVLGTGPYSTASGSVTPLATLTLTYTSAAGAVGITGSGTAASPYSFAHNPREGTAYGTFTASASATVYFAWSSSGGDVTSGLLVFPVSYNWRAANFGDTSQALLNVSQYTDGAPHTASMSVTAGQQFYVGSFAVEYGFINNRFWIA